MIEADKMLYLRRYLLTALRVDARSRLARPLHRAASSSSSSSSLSSSSPSRDRRGYVGRYAQHRCVALPSIVRTLATTVAESPLDDVEQKLTALCDDARCERVSADRLREVIKRCEESETRQLDADTGVLLLKCCGDLPVASIERQNLVDRLWRLASRDADKLTLAHYNALLDVHARNASSVDPREFLAGMRVQPDESTYRLLLGAAVKNGNARHLRDIVSVMVERNVTRNVLDEDAFCELVRAHMAAGSVDEAERAIALARDAELPVDRLYTELACGYAALGDIPNLVKILNDEPRSDANLLGITRALSASGNGRHIPVVVNFLMASLPAINPEILRTVAELVRANRAADAHTIVNCLALNGATAGYAAGFVDAFLNELLVANVPVEDVVRYASDFVDTGCEPLALSNVAELGLKLGRENLCRATFDAMRQRDMEIRPHYYWPLLLMAHHSDGESKVFSLVRSMTVAGVEVNSDTLINYVYPYVNTANSGDTLRKLQAYQIPNVVLYTSMTSFLLFNKRLQDAIALCRLSYNKLYYKELMKPLVRAYLATRDIEGCATMLTMFSSAQEFIGMFLFLLLNGRHSTFYSEDLRFLLEALAKHGARISPRDATVLKQKLASIDLDVDENTPKTIDDLVDESIENSALSAPILHPRYMSSKELTCLLVELKNKGFSTKTTLRRLLHIYCNENNLKKAEEIKREIDASENVEWTSGMKMNLFKLYLKHDKLREAEMLLAKMQDTSNAFVIDSDKLVLFATALVRANKPREAFDVIEKHSREYRYKRNDRQQQACYKLLSALALSEHHSYTQDMLQRLVEGNYCEISNELLRPLVAIPLAHNNFATAMNKFTRCVQRYKKTPLAQELLMVFLQERDNSTSYNRYIEEVYNMIVDIDGSEAANTMLVIGLAALNKTDELQSILQKQNISTSSLTLFNDTQKKNKVDILWRIFTATPNKLDQIVLSNLLLSAYSRVSDCNGALKLWKTMCAKSIEPSEQFKKNFIQFLLSNKVALPPEFEADESRVNVSD